MKSREYMLPHAHRMRVLDYCKHNHPYRKRTAFWVWNLDNWTPRPLCRHDCPFSRGKRHTQVAQRGGCMRDGQRDANRHNQNQLYSIPAELATELCEHIEARLRSLAPPEDVGAPENGLSPPWEN